MQTTYLYFQAILLLLWVSSGVLSAQDFSGQWSGVLTQEGAENHFMYQLTLEKKGNGFSGTACSTTADGSVKVCFLLTGIPDGDELILQEIQQTHPDKPRWCLKYLKLNYSNQNEWETLEGTWTADGCRPGKLRLQKGTSSIATREEEIPFSYLGTWTGYLQQSDRDYGFYYEVILEEGGLGKSHIVSEDNGGSAWHRLKWSVDEAQGRIVIKEEKVEEKTDPRWKWCIKSGQLTFERVGRAYQMLGTWSGYIEGYSPEDGGCAPGQLFLEKPVLTREVERKIEQNNVQYSGKNHREVKIDRVIEVKSETVRIKVWDNGTVDGDVVTIFLNGEQLLDHYRVSKRKWAIPVKLKEADNFIILHAEDLGEITPNTVAVSIDDGFKEEMVLVTSDLRTSGAIMIRKFQYKANEKN